MQHGNLTCLWCLNALLLNRPSQTFAKLVRVLSSIGGGLGEQAGQGGEVTLVATLNSGRLVSSN